MDVNQHLRLIEDKILEADKAGDVKSVQLLKDEHQRVSKAAARAGGTSSAPSAAAGAAGAPEAAVGHEMPDRGTLETLIKKGLPQIGAELVKGGAGLAMLPGELLRAGVNKIAGDDADFGRATKMVGEAVDSVVPPPETQSGKVGVKLASTAVGAAVAPGNLLRNLGTAGTSFAGGEAGAAAGEAMAGDNGRVIGGVIGSLAGGAPWAIKASPATYQEMVAEALKGYSPGELAKARQLAAEAKRQGVQLTPEQLFDRRTGLDELFNRTMRSGKAPPELYAKFLQQLNQTDHLGRQRGSRLGPNAGDWQTSRDLRETSNNILDAEGRTPASLGRQFDAPAQPITGQMMTDLDDRLAAISSAARGDRETQARLEDLRARLRDVTDTESFTFGSQTRVVPAKPGGAAKWNQVQTPVNMDVPLGADQDAVNRVVRRIQSTLDDLKRSAPAGAKLEAGAIGQAVQEVETLLRTVVKSREGAAGAFESRARAVDRLESSLIGRLAGRGPFKEDTPDPVGFATRNLGQADASEVKLLGQMLEKHASQQRRAGATDQLDQINRSMPQAVRAQWDNAMEAAFRPTADGRMPENAATLFANNLLGSLGSKKEKAFREQLRVAATSLGNDPDQFADGMVNFLRVLQASGRNRTTANLSMDELRRLENSSNPADVLRMFGQLSGPALVVERARLLSQSGQFKKLGKLFNDPNAVDIIIELAKTPVMSSRAGALTVTLLQTLAQPQRQGEQDAP